MGPPCPQEYEGIERRKNDRRQECQLHEHFEREMETMKRDIKIRVPNRLFFASVGGIITLGVVILAFQWTTYERMGAINVSHVRAMGEIKTEIQKVNQDGRMNTEISRLVDDQLSDAIERHVASTDKTVREIKESIEKMHIVVEKSINQNNHQIQGGFTNDNR